ncbi:Uncharacterized protein TCM_033354 [Theobroma cacao]|uniref:Uncharacterized protein n=1 Tax=Theobroma cacao TaxID=3641 RepID=A0A061FBK7_THECC|nr:Uncharacterized protein TCM_033354 [Theobroma cacao]
MVFTTDTKTLSSSLDIQTMIGQALHQGMYSHREMVSLAITQKNKMLWLKHQFKLKHIPIANQAIWLRRVLFDLNHPQLNPTMNYVDINCVIAITKNQTAH